MGKTELAMTPLQQWGEEVEDGAIYSIILERVRAETMANTSCHLQDGTSTPACPFVQYRTCKRRVLRAATLPKLVKWLVSANEEGDLDYIPSFLATYQAFATSAQVLELLLPLGPDRATLQVLELWLQHHPKDFWEPPEHHNLEKVVHFLRQSAPDSPQSALAEGLLQAYKQKEEAEEEDRRSATSARANGGESPGTAMPQRTTEAEECQEETPALSSFSVDEMAEQLTLMDAGLFRAVRLFHCMGCVWSQRDKKENQHMAPTVRATVAQFNAVTNCVIASLLGDLTLRIPQRAHLLEKWISIAQRCRALRNFSSLHAILSALQSNSIYRLKRTWAVVNRDSRSTFRKLLQIFSEDNNYLNCREILMQARCETAKMKATFGEFILQFLSPDLVRERLSSNTRWLLPGYTRLWFKNTTIFEEDLSVYPADTTWKNSLPEGGTQGACDEQKSPEMPARSSLKFRLQARLVAPTIPYLGTFLTDLIMLDTALPDFVEGNLINFEKRRKEAAILSWIHQLQDSCQGYNLSPNSSFCDALHQHQQLSEEQSYRISRVIEPPADSCPNSPKLHRSLTKRFSSLLMGSDSSAAASGFEKSGISPLGSCNSLNSEDTSSAPCSPTWVSPTVKNFPVLQPRSPSPFELTPTSPISKQQGTESRIVRVSMDNEYGNGNLYRSIVITSQDKTTAVVQRALQKHNMEGDPPVNYRLLQLLGDGQELLIPEGANAFYAMNPNGPHDFLLCLKERATTSQSLRTTQLGRKTALHGPLTLKDCGARTLAAMLPFTPSPACPPPPAVASQLRPCLLIPPSFLASPSWSSGVSQLKDFPDSPPLSPSLPLIHHSLTLRCPAPPDPVLLSSLQNSQTSPPK